MLRSPSRYADTVRRRRLLRRISTFVSCSGTAPTSCTPVAVHGRRRVRHRSTFPRCGSVERDTPAAPRRAPESRWGVPPVFFEGGRSCCSHGGRQRLPHVVRSPIHSTEPRPPHLVHTVIHRVGTERVDAVGGRSLASATSQVPASGVGGRGSRRRWRPGPRGNRSRTPALCRCAVDRQQ